MTAEVAWPQVLSHLVAGESLTEEVAAECMRQIMEGAVSSARIAAFAVALRAKGETVEEISGLVTTMRSLARRVPVSDDDLLDTCGTGGDRSGTFNVSTAAAFVCAGAGVKVAKHGNRAASSRCGSADVLEALGVTIDLPPAGVAHCIEEAGIGFCFAPVFHPAMRHAADARRDIGIATIFNFLGPLTNPAGATRQVIGVGDPRMVDKMVATLARLGSTRVLAFHGHGGLDELSLSGPTEVRDLAGGDVGSWIADPAELGLTAAGPEALAGGSADENAAAIRRVLDGERGPHRDVVALNAGAGLVAAGQVDGLAAGVERAQEAIDSGAATAALEGLVAASNR